MTKLSQVPARPTSRRTAPSYPRALLGIGAMMLATACGGTVEGTPTEGEAGAAGNIEGPAGAVANPYGGSGGATNNGGAPGTGGTDVGGSSGGGAPIPYGGSGGVETAGSGGDPAGDIAVPFDAGTEDAADSEPPIDGFAPNPYDGGTAGAGGVMQGEAPFPYEDGGTAGSCNTGGTGGFQP